MSNTAIANINHTSHYLSATTSAQTALMTYHPEKVLIENLGTGVLYVRASPAGDLTGFVLPTTGTISAWTSIGPGKSYTLNWSTTVTTKNLDYIASVAGDFTVKLTNGT